MGELTFAELEELYGYIMEDEANDFEWHALWCRNRFGISVDADDVLDFCVIARMSGVFDDYYP